MKNFKKYKKKLGDTIYKPDPQFHHLAGTDLFRSKAPNPLPPHPFLYLDNKAIYVIYVSYSRPKG